jgi:hypothetical protein
MSVCEHRNIRGRGGVSRTTALVRFMGHAFSISFAGFKVASSKEYKQEVCGFRPPGG